MLIEEFKYTLLRFLAAAMGHVPQFGLNLITSPLTLPSVVYCAEGLFYTWHRE